MRDVQDSGTNDDLDARTSARLSLRLRMARQMRGMTLKTLADAAGCSESLLSKIENAKAYPSLPMLDRLTKALDTSIGWMFEGRGKDRVVFRAGDRPTMPLASQGETISIERVVQDAERHLFQSEIIHIEAGAGSAAMNQHAGEETGYLLAGQLELTVDGQTHNLAAGDAFAFRADQPHAFRNTGADRTSVFWVVTPPVV